MGTRRRVERVCDICGEGGEIHRYRIEYLDVPRQITVDLCGEHGQPLEELAEEVPPKGGREAGMMKRAVLSESQLKRAKRKQKPPSDE